MADMQITVGLGREPRDDRTRVLARCDLLGDEITQKITAPGGGLAVLVAGINAHRRLVHPNREIPARQSRRLS